MGYARQWQQQQLVMSKPDFSKTAHHLAKTGFYRLLNGY